MKISSFFLRLFVSWEYTMSIVAGKCSNGEHNCGDVTRCRETLDSYYCLCPGQLDAKSSAGNQTLGWGDSCYSIINSNPLTWTFASQSCKQNSGDLVVIETLDEQLWLISQVQRLFPNSQGFETRWWYGLNKTDTLTWQWIDGTPLDNSLIIWREGEPNGDDMEKCAEMLLSGKFNDHSCATNLPYICERSTAVDECKDTNVCGANAECTNIPGGYTCICKSGFSGPVFDCQDINKCENTEENMCHPQAHCQNIPGSHRCACKNGFTGNGTSCSDIDECNASNTPVCHPDADCLNLSGEYSCTCKEGFSGDGSMCLDISTAGDQDEMQLITYIAAGSTSGVVLIILVIVLVVICIKHRRKLGKVETQASPQTLNTTTPSSSHEYANVDVEGHEDRERSPTRSSFTIPAHSLSEGSIDDLLYSNHKIKETRKESEEDVVSVQANVSESPGAHTGKPKPSAKPKIIVKEAEKETSEDLYSNKYIPETKKEQRKNIIKAAGISEANGEIQESEYDQLAKMGKSLDVLNEDDEYGHLYGSTVNSIPSETGFSNEVDLSDEIEDDISYSVLERCKHAHGDS